MRVKNISVILTGMMLGLVFIGATAVAAEPVEMNRIESIGIREVYEPGNGAAVGKIRQVSGRVVIVHHAQEYGYQAERELDLFQDDTVLTGKDGNVAFTLNDGSFVTLSSGTEIKINQSLYAPTQKTRSSFINMISGKARFVVKKFVDARHSEFKIKTKTSVAGVRGSDFIIAESETVTEITALADTELEVISLADLDARPVVIHDFEKLSIRIGMRPEEAQKVKSEEVDRMMKEFKYLPSNQTSVQQEFEAADVPLSMEQIHVAQEDLISPDFDEIRRIQGTAVSLKVLLPEKNILMDAHDIEEKQTRIYEERNEAVQTRPLPEFPGAPD